MSILRLVSPFVVLMNISDILSEAKDLNITFYVSSVKLIS